MNDTHENARAACEHEGEVLVERRGAVQWITLNRPERRNALNRHVVSEIGAAIDAAGADRSVRAIVVTGSGDRAFCAGADLASDTRGFAFDVDYSRPTHYVIELFRRIQAATLPVIARVNGHALAGGLGLLCACDMAVAADDIRIGAPEPKLGLTPMMILPYLLRVLPARRLQEICITGEMFSASDALAWGVVNYVVPRAELDAKLDWLLARVTDKSPTALRLGKQAYNAMCDMSLRDAFEYAQVMVQVMASTEDAREGIAAFREKRAAEWSAR